MTVAVPWLVLTTTGSAAVAGTAVFAGVASATVGGLAAGRVVDAIGPVRASAVADLLSGLAVAPLPVLLALDALEIWQVVLLTVLGTLADAAGSAARQSLVPAAADAGGYRRERANALFTSAEHVGYLLGAPAAGLLIAGLRCRPGALRDRRRVRVRGPRHARARGPVRRPRCRRGGPGCRAPRDGRVHLGRSGAARAGGLPDHGGAAGRTPRPPRAPGPGAGGLRRPGRAGRDGRRIRRRRAARCGRLRRAGPPASRGERSTSASSSCGPARTPRSCWSRTFRSRSSCWSRSGPPPARSYPCRPRSGRSAHPPACCLASSALSTASIPVAVPTGVLVTGFLIDGLGLGRASLLLTAAAVLVGAGVLTSPWTRHGALDCSAR